MASILTPPDRPTPLPPGEDGDLALWEGGTTLDAELMPHLLIQLEDDLERSRVREAFWISVVVHLMVVMFLVLSPKLFPGTRGVVLISPEDLMRNQQMTYLDLPPDLQKEPKRAPKTDVLSDKNRIAESRHPTLDKKTLEELKRAGPPKIPSAPAEQAQNTPPQQQAQPSQQPPNPAQGQPMAQLQPAIPQDNPRLPQQQQGAPKFPGNLAGVMSPGSSIEQAARAVASRRGSGSYGGGGDYGAGPNHVLPTGGSGRFSSPLGVATFMKRQTVLELEPALAGLLAPRVARLAEAEGLVHHARSASRRALLHHS